MIINFPKNNKVRIQEYEDRMKKSVLIVLFLSILSGMGLLYLMMYLEMNEVKAQFHICEKLRSK